MLPARSSVRLAFSSAASVLSKVGAAGSFAILSTFASVSAIAASRAGWNCSTFTWSNGGTPAYGPVQGARGGFFTVASAPAAGAGGAARRKRSDTAGPSRVIGAFLRGVVWGGTLGPVPPPVKRNRARRRGAQRP